MTHAAVMLAVTLAVAAGCGVGSLTGASLGGGVQVALLASAVAVLGLPHGAFDAVVGEELLRPRLGRWWGVWFSAGYLGLAALVVGLWVVAPAVGLASFFAAAAWHFGETDAGAATGRRSSAGVLGRGALTIAAPAAFHPAEVARLLRWTMPGDQPWMTPGATAVAGSVALGLCLLLLIPAFAADAVAWAADRRWRRLVSVAEVPALLALFAAAPPLVAFVVYFCGWHSPRHELHLVGRVNPSDPAAGLRSVVSRALPATAVTVVGAIGAVAWLASSGGATALSPSAVQVVFVGLSALTVPHMLLERWAESAGAKDHPPTVGASLPRRTPHDASASASDCGSSSGRRASRA